MFYSLSPEDMYVSRGAKAGDNVHPEQEHSGCEEGQVEPELVVGHIQAACVIQTT